MTLGSAGSGSPVFALSCQTRELELVGVVHASRERAHRVVAIDQVRELMETLRPTNPNHGDAPLTSEARAMIRSGIAANPLPFFPFAGRTARIEVQSDGSFVFQLMRAEFPARAEIAVALRDVPGPSVGVLDAVGATSGGWVWIEELEAGHQALAGRLLELLRRQCLRTLDYREALARSAASPEEARRAALLARELASSDEKIRKLVEDMEKVVSRLTKASGPRLLPPLGAAAEKLL